MIRKIEGASFRLDRHSHPGARVFLDHLEHSLWLTNGTALFNDIQQPAQRRIGIGIEVAWSSLILDPDEYVALPGCERDNSHPAAPAPASPRPSGKTTWSRQDVLTAALPG